LDRWIGHDSEDPLIGEAQDWLRACRLGLGVVEAQAAYVHGLTYSSFFDAVSLARLLRRRIEEKIPTSAIRLGDGEGHVVALLDFDDPGAEVDSRSAMRTWWGERDVASEHATRYARNLRTAIANADILGLYQWPNLLETSFISLDTSQDKRGILRTITASSCWRPGQGGVITSAVFPNDMEFWGLWELIVRGIRHASVISCHDLHEYIAVSFGMAVRLSVSIPPEFEHSVHFHNERADRWEGRTLHDIEATIDDHLDPEPGEIWFVAAGLFGKHYCETIRRRGGIAIDIGSLADQWAGYATRPYQTKKRTHQISIHDL
jgi:hypothetical protein